MDLVFYIYVMMFIHTLDESWNCSNPRMIPDKQYRVCQWDEDDFYRAVNGNYYLYPIASEDNYFERKARKRFWRKILKERG